MSGYNYKEEKENILTDEGQRDFLKVRDHVHKVLELAGSIRMDKAIGVLDCGINWTMMACVDRLVELGEIKEIKYDHRVGQHRIFRSL